MPSQLYSVVVDAHDPAALAGFWASALGYSVAYTLPDEVAIEAPDDTGPAIVFASVSWAKATKNRLHFELNPDDQVAEVARLTELGAQLVPPPRPSARPAGGRVLPSTADTAVRPEPLEPLLGVGGQRASPRAPTAPRSNCRASSITACRFPVLPSLEAIAVAARP